jgi:hypothetical protein
MMDHVAAGAVCIHLGYRRDHHRTLRCPDQTLTRRMFTTLRNEIDPAIAAISTLLTVVCFLLVRLAMGGCRRPAGPKGKPSTLRWMAHERADVIAQGQHAVTGGVGPMRVTGNANGGRCQ